MHLQFLNHNLRRGPEASSSICRAFLHVAKGDDIISFLTMKSGMELTPNGVKQLITPGVNPGYKMMVMPATPTGLNYDNTGCNPVNLLMYTIHQP